MREASSRIGDRSSGLRPAHGDDLAFPSHTLVWGIPGGRCGPILEVFGVCVVDQAGTADFELPSKNPLPSFAPFGSFVPLFSFGPYFSFEP